MIKNKRRKHTFLVALSLVMLERFIWILRQYALETILWLVFQIRTTPPAGTNLALTSSPVDLRRKQASGCNEDASGRHDSIYPIPSRHYQRSRGVDFGL